MFFINLSRRSFKSVVFSEIKCLNKLGARFFSERYGNVFAEKLKNKCLVELKGKDSGSLLQGLITNDIDHLSEASAALYTMFLNNKGRVMSDGLVFRGERDDTYFVECDSDIANVLELHLKKYKLRKNVTIKVLKDNVSIYSVICLNRVVDELPGPLATAIEKDSSLQHLFTQNRNGVCLDEMKFDGCTAFRDPRLPVLGYRVVVPQGSEMKNLNLKDAGPTELYRLCRYWLGVAEGLSEIPYEQCFPLETNCDYLHGVSFQKGCYIGQELTARSHHTGVIRKRIMPVLFDQNPSDDMPVDVRDHPSESSKKVGKLRAHHQRYGIALLRTAECAKLDSLYIGQQTVFCFKPTWWPQESPKQAKQDVT